jgi:hypothetical protein
MSTNPEIDIVRFGLERLASYEQDPELEGGSLLRGELALGKTIDDSNSNLPRVEGRTICPVKYGVVASGNSHAYVNRDLYGDIASINVNTRPAGYALFVPNRRRHLETVLKEDSVEFPITFIGTDRVESAVQWFTGTYSEDPEMWDIEDAESLLFRKLAQVAYAALIDEVPSYLSHHQIAQLNELPC